MIRPIAFCAGLALAWCGTAEAADFDCRGWWQSCSEPMQSKQQCFCANDAAHLIDCNLSETQARLACKPESTAEIKIDDLGERVTTLEAQVTQLKGLLKALLAFLPECTGEPPEHMPCIERDQ